MAENRVGHNTFPGTPAGGSSDASAGRNPSGSGDQNPPGVVLPRYVSFLEPFMDFVARINWTAQTKLFAVFMAGALLVVVLGVLNVAIMARMNHQVEEMSMLQDCLDRARQVENLITASSHWTAMTLLTRNDANIARIESAKLGIAEHLEILERKSPPAQLEFFQGMREIDARLEVASDRVISLYRAGQADQALKLHMSEEHPVAHELEMAAEELIADASAKWVEATAAYENSKRLLTYLVVGVAIASVAAAIVLGFAVSWAFIRPLRVIDNVLAAITGGDFTRRVDVPNRDEFGTLGRNVNSMSEHLEELYQELNTELAERRQAEETLVERNIELATVNQELEAFSYSVSHDLRSPLRSIDGFSQALLEDYQGRLDEAGQDYLHRVRKASQRMGQLIDDLLHLSRVTRSEMSREKVDVTTLAREIGEGLQAAEPGRNVDLTVEDGLVADADSRLLRLVLDNLIGNSWKFTGKEAQANIEIGGTANGTLNGEPAFFVRDNGAGFDMDYSDQLFAVFQSLHPADEFGGTGIGLAIVQRVIHRHGGRVWAEGAVDEGATFYFTLNSKGES